MPKKKLDYQIPWSGKGIPHYVGEWQVDEYTWLPNTSFQATLDFQGFRRGRSAAAYAVFSIYIPAGPNPVPPLSKKAEVTVFMTDMEGMIRNGMLDYGKISNRFVVQKRGANYGVRLANPDEP